MNRINKANLILAENLVEDIMDKFEACGIAAAIIDGDGNTVFEKFWGVRDKESGKEINGDTIFGIASVNKVLYLSRNYADGGERDPRS